MRERCLPLDRAQSCGLEHFHRNHRTAPPSSARMRWIPAAFFFLSLAFSHAAEEAGKTVVPALNDAIPAAVKSLPEPAFREFTNGLRIAVSAATRNAQDHVNQGLNNLHGGWEFEAMRHFAAAAKEDPDCLMAHWGLIMCMLAPSPETDAARAAATLRMTALVDAGAGTELERGYAYGLIKYGAEGAAQAAIAFRKVGERFPNDLQAPIFAALFGRGGYDALGEPTPDEQTEQKNLAALLEKHPDDPLLINALLFVKAEGPDPQASLPLARRLCQIAPDYPPYFHLLGHYAWRSGEHNEAASAFARAASYYRKWMKENNVTDADCAEWLKAECYRVVVLNSKGDFETAYAAAKQVASIPVPAKRPNSPGARFLLWDAKTLPARIVLARDLGGEAANQAATCLPDPKSLESIHSKSAAYVWIDALRFCLEAKKKILAADSEGARAVIQAITTHGEFMAKTQAAAGRHGESSPWLRAFRAFEVLAGELRGETALIGPPEQRGLAYNWFAAAADRQRVAPLLNPPMVLSPMARNLGWFLSSQGKTEDALAAYERALAAFPGDLATLTDLRAIYHRTGDKVREKQMADRIEALKEP